MKQAAEENDVPYSTVRRHACKDPGFPEVLDATRIPHWYDLDEIGAFYEARRTT